MALVFPSNPSVNDTYQVNGRTYVWNGTTWRTIKAPVPDVLPTLSVDNDFSAGGTLHVDSTNNEIGIGTAAPSHQLHLTQDLGVDGNLIVGGTITVPTPIAGTNDTTAATTAFVQTAVAGIVDSAPTTLDTLNELAAALGDDANFATTITNSIALKQDASTALTTSTTFGGDVSGTYNNIVVANDSHTHDGRYYTETESDARYTSTDSFQWRGTSALTSTTTSALKTELLNRDVFDSSVSAFKTSWSYAGNGNLTDAGGLTELAGTSWLTWTDNSADNTQGNFTALVIAPNTGDSSGGVFIYNDQGSGYSPGWREVWTSATDGSGSGLDADLLDGNHASAFATAGHTHSYASTSHTHSYLPTSGGSVSGTLSTNVITVSNEIQLDYGSATDPSITWSSDGDTGIYGGSDRVYITTSGTMRAAFGNNFCDMYGESRFYYDTASNDWSAQPIQAIAGTANDIGIAIRSFDSDTHTTQMRAASGRLYIRSHNDGGYHTVYAIISNQSSRKEKQDISEWTPPAPVSAGSMANPEYATTMSLLNQLQVVSYRWDKERYCIANEVCEDDPDHDDTHICGRDCDQTPEEPCNYYKNWERGTIGLVAEDVGAVIPQITDMDMETGENSAIDGLALSAVIVKALQEIDSRLTALEAG